MRIYIYQTGQGKLQMDIVYDRNKIFLHLEDEWRWLYIIYGST